MGKITISPKSKISGEIYPPGDKSISHRSIILGSIAEGLTEVLNFLPSEDCNATINAFEKMGVYIERVNEDHLKVHGVGLKGLKEPYDILDMGNSGTSMRLIGGILAGQPFYSVMTGDNSLRNRPMRRIAEPLRLMGAKIFGRKGDLAPLTIIGGDLKAIDYQTPVASAQVKSCIILAGLFADGETSVTEITTSRDHTERMLTAFGAEIQSSGLTRKVKGYPRLTGQQVSIPGDISSSAYFISAGLLCENSNIIIRNVGINPTRTGIIDALKEMGGSIYFDNLREESGEPIADLYVESSDLTGKSFSGDIIVRMIDEIPLLALIASQAEGETSIRNAEELRVKESDRIKTTVTELRKIGANIEELSDGMVIKGATRLIGGECESHGDHRMAMTLAIAGLISDNGTTINDVECVNTSFPNFWELLLSL